MMVNHVERTVGREMEVVSSKNRDYVLYIRLRMAVQCNVENGRAKNDFHAANPSISCRSLGAGRCPVYGRKLQSALARRKPIRT